MEPNQSKSSPDMAAEEDPSGFHSEQPLRSDMNALGRGKSGLEKKPALWSEQRDDISMIMDKVRKLNRKKDVVCLILSYPPFNSRNNETHKRWIGRVLEITHKAREALYMEKEVNVSMLSSEITRLLHHSIHDIEAHAPFEIGVEVFEWLPPRRTTPKKAMLDLCVDDFVVRQILQYMQIPEIRRILISQVNDKTFLCKLKNLPPIRQMFDLVIQVNVKLCQAIKDIEDRIIEELDFPKSSRGILEKPKFLNPS